MSAPPRLCECTACGAVVETDASALSTRCAYCDSPLVDAQGASAVFDAVVPFRIGRRAAHERLRAYIGERWWTPRALSRLARRGQLQTDMMRGALVPYFAYDATVRGDYSARVGLHWYRTETVRRPRHKDKAGEDIHIESESKRTVRETEWFDLRGSMATEYRDHLVCASKGLQPREAQQLLPFDLGRASAFDPRLMLGWHAERPTEPRDAVDRRARESIAALAQRHLANRHLAGDEQHVRTFESDIRLHGVRLLMLPVWIARVRTGRGLRRIVINGQTGHCSGPLPISVAKVGAAILSAVVIVAVVLWLRGDLQWM